MDATDRTVHAIAPDGTEITRYDKSGRWYLERPDESPRIPIRIMQAVQIATSENCVAILDLPGGAKFDLQVRKILNQRSRHLLAA